MKYPQVVSMPSAVSDWLEEQLEARGIDSVVYTRYILSLLHRDSADVICPDQDSCFTHPCKEVRRSGASRKRFRRTNDWWTYDQADVDQLKRSAAVECLMSASDQKCGIESLVDELCEKLRQINNDSIADTEAATTTTVNCNEASPQELANQYYAAFPPLSRKSSTSSPGVITLIPKWIGSPKKKQLRKQKTTYDDKFHCKVDNENMKAGRTTGKSRFNCTGRNKGGYCRNMAKSETANDWDLYTFNSAKSRRTKAAQKVKSSEQEQCLESNAWMNEDDDNMKMYEDLLDDIRELLNSPEPQEDSVALMNLANMRDTGRKTFIQNGTNITSSIWSVRNERAENSYNAALASQNTDVLLGIKFSSITIGGDGWPSSDAVAENKTNLLFEKTGNDFWNSCGYNLEKWSDAESYEDEIVAVHNIMTKSLMKLNHHKEKSSFTEVIPRATPRGSSFNGFNKSSAAYFFKPDVATKKLEAEKDKEDLLTSVRSHFKPINEKVETRGHQYADGTSFVIPNALDKVNYKRSESGTMYIDSEYGFAKKYLEYKGDSSGDGGWDTSEFVLKFNICQNDKACQTDFGNCEVFEAAEEDEMAALISSGRVEKLQLYFPDDDDLSKESEPAAYCRPNSIMGEIIWKCETKHCDKCNNNTPAWSRSCYADLDTKNIWNGGDICVSCLGASNGGYQPLNQQQTQLREDVSHDGEQLLSDLSSLQKSYMDELPSSEVTCDISELIEPKDRKRRHSNFYEDVGGHRGSWSFASRLKEDCLIQMSTIPTLRSVTL